MKSGSGFYVTNLYQCLVCQGKQTEDIFLTMCGIEQCLPGYTFHTEGRAGYHLHVILSGKGELCVGGVPQTLHGGQMFVTKPEEDTWYRADGNEPWNYCWMTFDGNNAPYYAKSAGFPGGVNWRDCGAEQNQFYTLVKSLLDSPEMTLSSDLRRLGLLLEFLSLAVDTNKNTQGIPRPTDSISADAYVNYARAYIDGNYATAKIGDVAKYIGINRSYLTSIFRQRMGVSPQQYLIQRKLKEASKLLLETDAPIQVIASRVGYEDPLAFSKTFKHSFGCSPRLWRLQKHKAAQE